MHPCSRSRCMRLLRSYKSQWGPGKVHGYRETVDFGDVPFCTNQPIHCERIKGTKNDVTCKKCKKSLHVDA
jgi:hypothetical protein